MAGLLDLASGHFARIQAAAVSANKFILFPLRWKGKNTSWYSTKLGAKCLYLTKVNAMVSPHHHHRTEKKYEV